MLNQAADLNGSDMASCRKGLRHGEATPSSRSTTAAHPVSSATSLVTAYAANRKLIPAPYPGIKDNAERGTKDTPDPA
jgi:hypothetical protein